MPAVEQAQIDAWAQGKPEAIVVKHWESCGFCKKLLDQVSQMGYNIHQQNPHLWFLEEKQLAPSGKQIQGWPNVTVYKNGQPTEGSTDDVYKLVQRLTGGRTHGGHKGAGAVAGRQIPKWTPGMIQKWTSTSPSPLQMVVKFAEWCGHCQKMKQQCEALGYDIHQENPELLFLEENQLSPKAMPSSFPNIVVYRGGQPVLQGTVQDLYQLINTYRY